MRNVDLDTVAEPAGGTMGGSLVGLSPGVALWFIGAVGTVFALLGVVPVYLEARRERSWREKLLARVDKANSAGLNDQLLKAAGEPAEVRGFTRGLISLLIVALIGLGLAAAMVLNATDAGDVRKNIITALTTVLATLAGFYFGSRTSQNIADDASKSQLRGGTADGAGAEPGTGDSTAAPLPPAAPPRSGPTTPTAP